MAIGVDTSKWKPRRLRGTPAATARNVIAYGICALGVASGLYLHFSKYTKGIKEASEVLYEDPIPEVERRMLIAAGLPITTREEIDKLKRESSRPDQPYI